MKERYDLSCNIAQSLNIIGDRWTLLILHELLVGRETFSEIKHHLKGISSKLLSDRLKYLEEAGLLESTLYSAHPPRYRYRLTDSGRAALQAELSRMRAVAGTGLRRLALS